VRFFYRPPLALLERDLFENLLAMVNPMTLGYSTLGYSMLGYACRPRLLIVFTLAAGVLTHGGLLPTSAFAQGWLPWSQSSTAQPGTPQWWSANEGKAQFVPGKGYQVEGVEGFFDKNGRSIDAPIDEIVGPLTYEKETKGLLPGLDPKISYRRAKEAMGLGPNQQIAQEAFALGQRLLGERRYAEAAGKFKTAVDRWPNSAVADRAQFLLGECYFFQDRYVEARDAYDALVARQPNTRDLDTLVERQWSIAQYWEKYYFDYKQEASLKPNWFDKTRPTLDTIGHAIKTYDSIRLNDPTGPRADDAIMATAGIYFRRGRYFDADDQYALLRREYPRSEHQFEAHLLGLQCKLRKYQGPDYDGAPLEEAKALAKQIRTQFAGRLTDQEKQRLREVQAQVQASLEQRDLRLAQYYDNTEHYGAARQIYAKIQADHGDSPIAQQAKARLAELGGAPDEPAKRLAWFVDLFPENRERSRVAQIPELQPGAGTRLAENPGSPTGDASGGVMPASATTTR